jgi:SAM-dependent methyltransferase
LTGKLILINCDLCGEKNNIDYLKILKKCLKCNHIFAPVFLNKKEASVIYKGDYFNGEEYSNYLEEEISLKKNFALRQQHLKKYLTSRHKVLLEVGCAYGFYLDIVKNSFEYVEGIDISHDAIKHSKNVKKLNVSELDLIDFKVKQPFDVVCMWDTIEHLSSPNSYVKKIGEILNPSGIFAFTTGDIGSFVARLRGKNWRMIHPPTHIHYFSKPSIKFMLKRHGFELLDIKYSGNYRTLDNIIYNLFVLRNNLPWVYNLCKFMKITKLSICLNLFDIMTVVARKK